MNYFLIRLKNVFPLIICVQQRRIEFPKRIIVSLIKRFPSSVKRKDFDWSVRGTADGHSSECRGLDFAKLSSLSCSQSPGPRYLRQFEVSTVRKRLRGRVRIWRVGENSRAMVRRVVGLVLCWIIY